MQSVVMFSYYCMCIHMMTFWLGKYSLRVMELKQQYSYCLIGFVG